MDVKEKIVVRASQTRDSSVRKIENLLNQIKKNEENSYVLNNNNHKKHIIKNMYISCSSQLAEMIHIHEHRPLTLEHRTLNRDLS